MKYIDITFENFGKKHLDQSEHLGINNAWVWEKCSNVFYTKRNRLRPRATLTSKKFEYTKNSPSFQ